MVTRASSAKNSAKNSARSTSSSGLDTFSDPGYPSRTSRTLQKRKAWSLVFDFFENSALPDADDTIIRAAVDECVEWKRYTEQDTENATILHWSNELPSADEANEEEENEKIKQEATEFKLDGKLWVRSGLIHKPASENDRKRFSFPLPDGEGLRRINSTEDFKLPYGIYSPTVADENQVYKWKHNLKQNQWLVEHTNKKRNTPWRVCYCASRNGTHCSDSCLNRSVQYECTSHNCSFGNQDCGNRRFTNLIEDLNNNNLFAQGYEVRPTEKKGLGLFAVRSYNVDSLTVEYTGEVIDLDEVDRRLGTIYKNETKYFFLGMEKTLVIDAGCRGSVARFVNHSCDPNCEMQKWYVNQEPRIGLFARRPIYPGDEITYDYNFEWYENSEPQKCYCESKICRGVIGKKPDPPVLTAPTIEESIPVSPPTEPISEPINNKKKESRKAAKKTISGKGQPSGTRSAIDLENEEIGDDYYSETDDDDDEDFVSASDLSEDFEEAAVSEPSDDDDLPLKVRRRTGRSGVSLSKVLSHEEETEPAVNHNTRSTRSSTEHNDSPLNMPNRLIKELTIGMKLPGKDEEEPQKLSETAEQPRKGSERTGESTLNQQETTPKSLSTKTPGKSADESPKRPSRKPTASTSEKQGTISNGSNASASIELQKMLSNSDGSNVVEPKKTSKKSETSTAVEPRRRANKSDVSTSVKSQSSKEPSVAISVSPKKTSPPKAAKPPLKKRSRARIIEEEGDDGDERDQPIKATKRTSSSPEKEPRPMRVSSVSENKRPNSRQREAISKKAQRELRLSRLLKTRAGENNQKEKKQEILNPTPNIFKLKKSKRTYTGPIPKIKPPPPPPPPQPDPASSGPVAVIQSQPYDSNSYNHDTWHQPPADYNYNGYASYSQHDAVDPRRYQQYPPQQNQYHQHGYYQRQIGYGPEWDDAATAAYGTQLVSSNYDMYQGQSQDYYNNGYEAQGANPWQPPAQISDPRRRGQRCPFYVLTK